jgi:probable HAF family extracellular repeat protein
MKAVAKHAVLLASAIFSVGCGGGSPTPAQLHATSQASPATSAKLPAKHYQVIDLVPIPGANNGQANAISNGHVAGYSVLVDGTARATLWHDGIAEDLGVGSANAINSLDQVVGYIQPNFQQGDFTPHASLWDHGILTDLGTLPGFDSTDATGINDSGEVVGIAFSFANPQNQAGFRWTVQTGIQVISPAASALAINSHGDIAGIGLNLHAAIFSTKKRTTDLGTLGGDFSVAGSLNTKGHAAGYSPLTAGGPVHAFFFAGKGLQDLGTFGTGDNSVATGVNDSDLVVGYDIVAQGGAVAHIVGGGVAAHVVSDSGLWRVGGVAHDLLVGTSRPFVSSPSTGMQDLNSLISDSEWSLLTASGIDQTGEIVGAGVLSGPAGPVAVHGFMLISGN